MKISLSLQYILISLTISRKYECHHTHSPTQYTDIVIHVPRDRHILPLIYHKVQGTNCNFTNKLTRAGHDMTSSKAPQFLCSVLCMVPFSCRIIHKI